MTFHCDNSIKQSRIHEFEEITDDEVEKTNLLF